MKKLALMALWILAACHPDKPAKTDDTYSASCLEKDYTGMYGNDLVVGLGSEAQGACNVLIGSYLSVPESHPDYFENIGNRLCRDIRTDQSLDCKTGLPINH
jgi:hypothetical protein